MVRPTKSEIPNPKSEIMLETLVDFPDDALSCEFPLTPQHIDAMMATFAVNGIERVIWIYYYDGHGGPLLPVGLQEHVANREAYDTAGLNVDTGYDIYAESIDNLVNPLRVAAAAAHRHGMELYACFKPYEAGVAMLLPHGSPEGRQWGRLLQLGGYMTWIDPFVLRHPELRLKRRTDDMVPGDETAAITSIRLTKKDDAPTRVSAGHLQIWTSNVNYRYTQLDIDLDVTETVEPSPDEVRDIYGNVVTEAGAPVRILTLSGFVITDQYVVVTTDFDDGPWDFDNAWDRLFRAFDAQGRELPGVHAAGTNIWDPEWENFREGGLAYDTGRGPEVVFLDAPNSGSPQVRPPSGIHTPVDVRRSQGAIGFARGYNYYLPGALCETEPQVRDYWLSCVQEMLDAGVDGIDFRVENHSTHTDNPQDYGFNDAVLAQVPPGTGDVVAEITRIRTEAYTAFLAAARQMISGADRKMRVTLNTAWFRPPEDRIVSHRLAYPANIDFDWRQWIDEGLMDGAVLRMFGVEFDAIFGGDTVVKEMIDTCVARNLPVAVNRYVSNVPELLDEFKRVLADARFGSFVLYEANVFVAFSPDGGCDLVYKIRPDWTGKALTSQAVEAVCEYSRASKS